MINALHLLWIIPLSAMIGATIGVFVMALMFVNKFGEKEDYPDICGTS